MLFFFYETLPNGGGSSDNNFQFLVMSLIVVLGVYMRKV
jgi:hypothetical protein